MDLTRLRVGASILYAIVIVAALLIAPGASLFVIVIGAMLIGLLYFMTSGTRAGVGRQRNRNRNRDGR